MIPRIKFRWLSFFFAGILFAGYAEAQKVLELYSSKPPGSENWDWSEAVQDSNAFQTPQVYNVVQPTLTVFEPEPGKGNGTAVIIAPGGGFYTLSVNREGADVAKWLQSKGITAFVLKYRLIHTKNKNPVMEMIASLQSKKVDSLAAAIIPLAVADGIAAMDWVRRHSLEYKIRPDRIGMMGFSAGGVVAMGVVSQAPDSLLPAFIAPIYAYLPDDFLNKVPTRRMPAFIAAASDDQLGLTPHSIRIYQKWTAARQPAELHLYEKGGHGFGMKKQNLPVDQWIERFGEWMKLNGYLQ